MLNINLFFKGVVLNSRDNVIYGSMIINYFQLFELPLAYEIDEAALQRAYVAKQREFHPDRLVGQADALRQKSMLMSMEVNQAYQTLKHQVRRAEHMLALEGIQVNGEQDSVKPDMTLLMEVMEMREKLAGAGEYAQIQPLHAQAKEKTSIVQREFAIAYAQGEFMKAASLAMHMRYLEKFLDEARVKLHKISEHSAG